MSRRFVYKRMAPSEFAAALDRLGWSHRTFARLFGFEPRRVTHWCRGEEAVPYWVPPVMAVAENVPGAITAIRDEAANRIISDTLLPERGEYPYLGETNVE
jgi:hypothetical protein